MSLLKITDNHPWKALEQCNATDEPVSQEDVDALARIANKPVEELVRQSDSTLLVFPPDLSRYGDEIGELSIFSMKQDGAGTCQIATGNLMGFIGRGDTQLTIGSRFNKNGKEDYFLHYMLQRVFAINLFDLKHGIAHDAVFDFLLYLFPYYLKKALRQGLFKEYIRREHNDARVRGTINVSRHIRQNIPFSGNVAYDTREHSYDNPVTQLIRHTIEYIRTKPNGRMVLNNDAETKEAVRQIVSATPTFAQSNRAHIINENIRPIRHPYFTEYTLLQKICLQILRHERIKFGNSHDKIYGILFDGAWLWEEYLYTLLKENHFKHPQNKRREGGIKMFANPSVEDTFGRNSRRIYPDFFNEDAGYILDAKYKHLNGSVGRDDLYQVVSYMHCMKAGRGGYLYPNDNGSKIQNYELAGHGGTISVIPFDVPQDAVGWESFCQDISKSETQLKALTRSDSHTV